MDTIGTDEESQRIGHRRYDSFNDAVNAYFFDGRRAHTPVYLDLEDAVKLELAAKLRCKPEMVETLAGRAVASTLNFSGGNPYDQQLRWLGEWEQSGRREPPPFTGLLCVLSLAAEKMRADGQFSSTNYYHRLSEVLGFEQGEIRPRLTANAKSTRRFWRAMNLWLTEHDFELGRPTARQVNSWKYASYAISQALVRDGDRRSFHQLFQKLDLSPNDDVSDGEMALYIHEWMATTSPSTWLRRIWGVNDLRERVVAAALAELETWDHKGKPNFSKAGPPSGRFSWIAAISGFPRQKCTFWLCAPGRETHTIEGLGMVSSHSAATREALSDCPKDLVLSPLGVGDVLALGPANLIAIDPLMHASFELEAKESKRRFVHTPKPVIPLARSETGPFYREVSRVSILKEHLVLCHENWAGAVEEFLENHASPGFACTASAQLAGIPKGWSLFRGVVIASSPNIAPDNLAALVPIAGGASIQFSGGLRLGAGIWHPEAPPRVAAVLEEASFDFLIHRETLDNETAEVSLSSKKHAVSVDLNALSARDGGNFRAVIARGDNEKAEKAFAFRSAATPRPTSSETIAYHLGEFDPRWAISGIRADKSASDSLQGLRLPERLVAAAAVGEAPCNEIIRYEAAIEGKPNEETLPAFKAGNFEAATESCVIRGYHYWIVDSFEKDDNWWEAKRQKCRDCGISTMTRSRARTRKKLQKKNLQFFDAAKQKISTRPETPGAASPDLILDALCYLGQGSWSTFQNFAAAVRDDLWYPRDLAYRLVGLGHIDLELDLNTMRPKRWQVAPPTLAESAERGIWFLAGYRCHDLVGKIAEALRAIGCERVNPQPGDTLSMHAWRCDSADTLVQEAMAGIVDPLGRKVEIVNGTAERLAPALPTLSELRDALPSVHMESPPDLQVFDLHSGKWRDTTESHEPGAYRSSYGACRYFHRSTDGSARAGTVELVKTLAASYQGIALHGYEEETGTFSAVLGCEPPGLFLRALIACSGREPKHDNGRVLFADVPPRVAQIILSKLYAQGK